MEPRLRLVDHCDVGKAIIDGNSWVESENVNDVKRNYKNERGKSYKLFMTDW